MLFGVQMKCKGASAFFNIGYVVWIWLGGESFTTYDELLHV